MTVGQGVVLIRSEEGKMHYSYNGKSGASAGCAVRAVGMALPMWASSLAVKCGEYNRSLASEGNKPSK